jgi:hypothetical protein
MTWLPSSSPPGSLSTLLGRHSSFHSAATDSFTDPPSTPLSCHRVVEYQDAIALQVEVLAPRSEIAGTYDGGQQRRWIADDLRTMATIESAAGGRCRTITVAVSVVVGGDPYLLGVERPTPSFVQEDLPPGQRYGSGRLLCQRQEGIRYPRLDALQDAPFLPPQQSRLGRESVTRRAGRQNVR